MRRSDGLLGGPRLDYEAWMDSLRSICGRHDLKGVERNTFTGWVRPIGACGFRALDIGAGAHQFERTQRDVRLDGADHYAAVFQVAGQSALIQSDRTMHLAVGDVALVDAARPLTCSARNGSAPWNCVALHLPRQALVSHLGFEPPVGLCGRARTPAARLLFDLVCVARQRDEAPPTAADSYLQLAVYDLIGALFAPPDRPVVTRHTDKLLTRIRGLITDRFTDPDFGPREVAAEAGISLRYVQKLFTQHGSTCSEFIYSVRLDHAARLLDRRTSLGVRQPLSVIAYACGFSDYTHFARKFRQRFGYTPGRRAEGHHHADDRVVRAGTGSRASSAHEVETPAT